MHGICFGIAQPTWWRFTFAVWCRCCQSRSRQRCWRRANNYLNKLFLTKNGIIVSFHIQYTFSVQCYAYTWWMADTEPLHSRLKSKLMIVHHLSTWKQAEKTVGFVSVCIIASESPCMLRICQTSRMKFKLCSLTITCNLISRTTINRIVFSMIDAGLPICTDNCAHYVQWWQCPLRENTLQPGVVDCLFPRKEVNFLSILINLNEYGSVYSVVRTPQLRQPKSSSSTENVIIDHGSLCNIPLI